MTLQKAHRFFCLPIKHKRYGSTIAPAHIFFAFILDSPQGSLILLDKLVYYRQQY